VTGMSGAGKSTALAELGRRGFPVVDTDSPAWSEWIPPADGAEGEWHPHEIDASRPLADVVDALIAIGQETQGR